MPRHHAQCVFFLVHLVQVGAQEQDVNRSEISLLGRGTITGSRGLCLLWLFLCAITNWCRKDFYGHSHFSNKPKGLQSLTTKYTLTEDSICFHYNLYIEISTVLEVELWSKPIDKEILKVHLHYFTACSGNTFLDILHRLLQEYMIVFLILCWIEIIMKMCCQAEQLALKSRVQSSILKLCCLSL